MAIGVAVTETLPHEPPILLRTCVVDLEEVLCSDEDAATVSLKFATGAWVGGDFGDEK